MDYNQFLFMREEITLIILLVFLFLFDLFSGVKSRRYFQLVACVLLGVQALAGLRLGVSGEAFGGMYVSTPIISIVKCILSLGTLIVFMQSDAWLRREDTRFKRGEFYVLTLSTLLGMFFMISSGNFMIFFIGLELASIPMAALVAFDKYKHQSAEAGAKYILSALFSSALLLYGISLIYGTTGTLYFSDITAGIVGSPIQIMAYVFFFTGMAFKLSLVPFHLWTADVYQGAPTNVSSYLSVISKGSAAFVLMIILTKVFAPIIVQWQAALYGVIVVTITVGNLFALRQKNIKRFMAFSSISQSGYIMLAVISGSALGMTSLVYYVLVYMAANLAIFGVISIVEQRNDGRVAIADYNGLYRTNPKLSLVMMLALFSLAGIPPFAGFFSKFFVFMAAFEKGYTWLVFIALINTVVSLFYYLKIVKAMYITPNDSPLDYFRSDNYTRLSLVCCMIGIVTFGIVSSIYQGLVLFVI